MQLPGCHRFTAEATDAIPGQGPLRGLLTAFEHAPTNDLVVLPVDMPNVTAAPLAWLAEQLRQYPDAAAIMLRRCEDGKPNLPIEPLPAASRTHRATTLICSQLLDHKRGLHRLTESDEILVLACPPDWPSDFWHNLNTPADLIAYSRANSIA